MDDNEYYIGFTARDGSLVQLSIAADSPIRVECYSHERDRWPDEVTVGNHDLK
jgi:hypothetical protein